MVDVSAYQNIKERLDARGIVLVAVSKTKPVEDILALYNEGHRDFGENRVQELVQKQPLLPDDIRWHMIGHLQTNKVKSIVPFVHLIHSVDSEKLFMEIAKQAEKTRKPLGILLQAKLGAEETKYGMDFEAIKAVVNLKRSEYVYIKGIMGMATFTDNMEQVQDEFMSLGKLYTSLKEESFVDDAPFDTCSMGMSGDYEIAIKAGSNMVRIGSAIFGARN